MSEAYWPWVQPQHDNGMEGDFHMPFLFLNIT